MKKYPLLQSQLGVFLDWQKYPDSVQYNLPMHAEMERHEDAQAIAEAWKKVIRASAVLRNRFAVDEEGNLCQWPDDDMPINIPIKQMSEAEAQAYIRTDFVRPFDVLGGEPLFRIELIETEARLHMIFDIHHLVIDGLSCRALIERELRSALEGKDMPVDESFYKLAESEQEFFASEEYAKAREYFVGNLQGLEMTSLSNLASAEGRLVSHAEKINKKWFDGWCREHGVDGSALFQGAFALTLGRLARAKTPVYCTSYHNRVNRKMMKSQGMFVNNVPLKANLSPDITVLELVRTLKEDGDKAYAMGRCPFTHLNDELGILSRVSFNFRPFVQMVNLGHRKYPLTEIPRSTGQTDISVDISLVGEDYIISVLSSDAVNSAETVRFFSRAIKSALRNMMDKPEAALGEIALVRVDEAKELLKISTGEVRNYDSTKTWLDLFKAQAAECPNAEAVVDERGAYTYGELDALSDSVAQYLINHSVQPNDFVAIKVGRTKDFMVATIGIWKAGAAYIPMDSDCPDERIRYMLDDSEAKLLLDDGLVKEAEQTKVTGELCPATPESRAYMIYTSGSTGNPKGVVIPQSALLNLVCFIRDRWGHTEKSRIACHSNFAFDASVEDLYPVLTAGGTLYIVPEEPRKDIMLMRAYIKDNGITGGCYTTQFGQLLGDVDEPLRLDYIVLGGEKMTAVPNITGKVYNTYGPTEFTVDATYCEVDRADYADIPIGRPLYNCRALILDTDGNLLPLGAVGELCMAGPQVAVGYWNLPEKTREVFKTVILPDGSEQRIYRTGDLARYNNKQELEYLGRIDFQVKLRGFRIELGEIDTRAMAFAGIRQALSQVKQERIVLYYVADNPVSEEELKSFLGETMPDYMVPSIYMSLPEMPMTGNGKVNLKALPEPAVQREELTAPETEMEAVILRLAKTVLRMEEIGTTTNLVAAGMSSLDTMRLNAALAKELGSSLRVSDILKAPTVRDIAALEEHYTEGSSKLRHHKNRQYYPLTENQRGVYLDWAMHSDTTQYNMPGVYRFASVPPATLADALTKVIDTHDYMKMRLAKVSGNVVQEAHPGEAPVINVETLTDEPAAEFFQQLVKPFDVLSERLYRANIYSYGGKTWLFLDVHHLICDGLSFGVLFDDLIAALRGDEPAKEQITAYDYALYEKEILSGEEISLAEEYFENLLKGVQAVSYPDSAEPDGKTNASVEYKIPRDAIDAFCKTNEVTPGSLLQSAFGVVLKRLTGEDKPLYLMVSNGRTDPCLAETVGMFVRTLPAVYAGEGKVSETARHYVKATYGQLQETYAREMVSYARLVEKHGLRGEIMFAYQGGISDEVEGATAVPLSLDTAKFPVMVTVTPDKGEYKIVIEYDGMRYAAADMNVLARAFGTAALSLVQTDKLKDVRLVDEKETRELIRLGEGRKLERDESETILSFLQKRVAETPDAPALVFREKKFTYREIDDITTKLAVFLHKNHKIGSGDIVSVMIGRSELMLLYPMAIIKTGAAYMPIDPAFPTERLAFMCEDAGVRMILSENNLVEEKLPDFAGERFYSDALAGLPSVTEAEVQELTAPKAHDLLVILFTSGTTGKPKAVALEHYGVVNYCYWYADEYALTMEDHVAGYANFGFDAHMIDLYPSMLAGSTVYLLDSEIRMDIAAMNAYMEENAVTVAFLTTQIGCLISKMNHSLRCLSTGGEKMPPVTPPDYRFLNVYGPTECSLFSTYYDVPGYFEGKLIGRPLANYQLFIIDKTRNLVPRGACGELLIAGQGVARGYMNRPELTADKFIEFRALPNSEPVRAYRSGDLVRWSEDGNIEYLGRIDNQVKLRGLRIELGEIENRVASYPGIVQTVVDVKGTTNQQLCCYYVADTVIDVEALKKHLAESLTEYMVPEVYMCLNELPLNPNGKVDRRALPEPEVIVGEIIAPETEDEQKIFEAAVKILGKDSFGVTNNLIALGMSSIAAMRLAAALEGQLGIKIRVADIMKKPTVRDIAEYGKSVAATVLDSGLQHYPERPYYPITENQRGLFIDWEMNRGTTQYNVPSAYEFEDMSADVLAEAIGKAVNLHAYLKSRLVRRNGGIMQQPHADEQAKIKITALTERPDAAFFQKLVRPFDLLNDRLYRFEIFTYEQKTYLFMDVHHIIYDGMSGVVFLNDLFNACKGVEGMPEKVTAYDYAVYEQKFLQSEAFAEVEKYYDELLDGATSASYPDSAQPDRPNQVESNEEAAVSTLVRGMPAVAIDEFCRKYAVTPGEYLQAAFAEVLHGLTREDKPMYLTISNGRSAGTELQNTVGMYVRTLPVVFADKVKNHRDESVVSYVRSVQQQLQMTFEREIYPYTKFVEKHGLRGEIMFAYQGGMAIEVEGAAAIPLSLDMVKFPVMVTTVPDKGEYKIIVEYDGRRYSASDMDILAHAFAAAASSMAQANKIKDVRLVDEQETKELMHLGEGRTLERDESETILSFLQKRAAETPDAPALVFREKKFTYREIDDITTRLAVFLHKNYRIGSGDIVGVMIGRSELMLLYPIAIIKTGAAYMPIDPAFPTDRLAFMCEDAGIRLILSENNLVEEKLPDFAGEHFYSGALAGLPSVTEAEAQELTAPKAHDLLVILFTSGTTGKPKAVALEHYGVVNFCYWYADEYALTMEDHVAGYANFGFDAHMIDLYPSILAGSTVYLLDSEIRMDIAAMNAYMEENDITVAFMTTQIGCLISEMNHSLRCLSTGGEKMPPVTPPDYRFLNVYGPTECSLFSTYYDVPGYFEGKLIGRPLANYQLFIIDKTRKLVPRGASGELLIAGQGVARGYMNRPELTADKFIEFRALPDSEPVRAYRSGDLVRWSEDGNIEYLGRIDNQVKLRGLRIELGEIENRVASYPGIVQTVVDVKGTTTRQLCCYYVSEADIDVEALKKHLSESLTAYMVPEVYMRLDVLPLNPNGKVDRRALPEPKLTSSNAYVEPETEAEKAVAESMARILGIDAPVGALDNFFELGGDSIKAIRMVSLIRQAGYRIQVSDIMNRKIVRAIASVIRKEEAAAISTQPFEGAVPDTAIVRYFKYLDVPDPQHYCQATLWILRKPCSKDLLRQAINAIAKQHDLLRAIYKDGGLFVRPVDAELSLQEVEVHSEQEITELCSRLQANIDMARSLLNIALIHEGGRSYLYIAAHHLIIDGVSWRVIASDLEIAIAAIEKGGPVELPMKTNTYNDYAKALQIYRNSYKLAQEIPYWENVQKEMLSLSFSHEKDYSRKILHVSAALDEKATQAFIRANFAMMNANINDALLTAVCLSYAAMSGENNLSVQLEGHGREDIGGSLITDRTVGWFTSIYPVIFKHIGGSLPDTFVKVKESLHRVPNKGVGYNVLRFLAGEKSFPDAGDRIARLGFNYLGEMDAEQAAGDSVLGTSDIPVGPALSARNNFGNDLALNALVEGGRFGLDVAYNSGIYNQEQIESFVRDIFRNMGDVADYLASLTEKQYTASDLGETEWSEREFRTVMEDFAARDEEIERIYPLTPMQEGMLFKYLSDPKSWAYRIVTIFELDVLPDEAQLAAALDRMATKHEVLRTSIIYDGVKKARQAIIRRKLVPHMVDVSDKPNPKKAAESLRRQILSNAFELQRKPLFQVTCAKKDAGSCYLIVAIHHAIEDGWCMGLCMNDLFRFLSEEITLERTPDQKPDNGKYERAVREILGKDKTEGLTYWRKLLADYETRAEIPSLGEVPMNEQSENNVIVSTLDKDITDKFLALCSAESATVSNGVELAWGMVLQTYCRTDDVVFAKVVSGRDNTEEDVSELVAAFINSVPVRVRIGQETTARQMLRVLQQQAAESNKYDYCPLFEIQQQTDLGADLFQNIIAFQNYDSGAEVETADAQETNLAFNIRPVLIKEESFDEVTPAMFINNEGQLSITLTFNRKHYRRSEIETVGKLFGVLITEMVKKPDAPIVSLARVGEDDMPALMALSKGDELAYDNTRTWLDLFKAQVAERPMAEAVADEHGSLTYAELDHASDQVACWLIDHGVEPDNFVAVKMDRVKEFVVAFMGIHKAGAAFVPIDPAYPQERIAYIEEDAQAKVTLTEASMPEIFKTEAKPVNRTSPRNFAYMIYTSGSTSKPKGAVIYQKGLMNLTVSMVYAYGYTPDDRISSHRSFSFDGHIDDFYPPLSAGASVHIMPERIRRDPDQIYEFLEERKITGGGYTTALARILKNGYPLHQRFISCGGEALQGVVSDDVLFYNEYGPTECTNASTLFILEKGVNYETIPIGRPLWNTYCFLLDKNGNLVPPGVRGEICLAGPHVGYGYWNRPELTEAVFVNCPFVPGMRMYHTGDLGYYDKNGQIIYAGRIDFQIKLHGYRIELGEIESRAAQYSGIKMVNAQVKKDSLVLYYSADCDIDSEALRAFLTESLASYMVPTVYMQLDEMPLTPNGKINRKALPEPDVSAETQNVPPENRLEENCLRIAREILPGVTFGVTDDLKSLGLNSLKAMLLTSRLNNELRMRLRVSDIMRYKTIRGFVKGKRRYSWLYDEYDEKKPVLVFVQGIVTLNDTAHLHALFDEYFNVFVIEPIQNHYERIFVYEHYDEVVAFYLTIAQLTLPEDAKIVGFIGFSFGGAIAYGMAAEWEKMTGEKLPVIMGDTTLPTAGKRAPQEVKKTTVQDLRKMTEAFEVKEHEYTDEELQIFANLNNMVSTLNSQNSLAPYDGEVIFLNAHLNTTEKMMREKMDALHKNAPQAEIHDFVDYSHGSIFVKEEMHSFYRRIAQKLLGKGVDFGS